MAIDRKALIRQYKETTPSMGVGVVRNKTTGLALVVAGRDLPSLLNRHRAQLRLKRTTCSRLALPCTGCGNCPWWRWSPRSILTEFEVSTRT